MITLRTNTLLTAVNLLVFNVFLIGQNIRINEFSPDPTLHDGAGGEFIELYCPNDNIPCDISCYILSDGQGLITIPDSTSIAPDSYYLIASATAFNCDNCDFSGQAIDLDLSDCKGCLTGGAYSTLYNKEEHTLVIGTGLNRGEFMLLYDKQAQLLEGLKFNFASNVLYEDTTLIAAQYGNCPSQSVYIPAKQNLQNTNDTLRSLDERLSGCNSSYALKEYWTIEQHPTPRIDNMLGAHRAFQFFYSKNKGQTWDTLTSNIQFCQANQTIQFKASIYNYQQVEHTIYDTKGREGSFLIYQQDTIAWDSLEQLSTGVSELYSPIFNVQDSSEFHLQWSDLKRGCCQAPECFETTTVQVYQSEAIDSFLKQDTLYCTDKTGHIELPYATHPNLRFELWQDTHKLASSHQGIFNIPHYTDDNLHITIKDETACSQPQTWQTAIHPSCKALPTCSNLPQLEFSTSSKKLLTFFSKKPTYISDSTSIKWTFQRNYKPSEPNSNQLTYNQLINKKELKEQATLLYQNNFDSLPAECGKHTLLMWKTILDNWFLHSSDTILWGNDGSKNSGAFYSYGLCDSLDRALGSRASASTDEQAWGFTYTNDSPYPIHRLILSFYGEQWRRHSDQVQKLNCAYKLEHEQIWTPLPKLTFSSPQLGKAQALNGNDSLNRQFLSDTLLHLNLLPKQSIQFRWIDEDDTGNDHGLAIDEVTLLTLDFPQYEYIIEPIPYPSQLVECGDSIQVQAELINPDCKDNSSKSGWQTIIPTCESIFLKSPTTFCDTIAPFENAKMPIDLVLQTPFINTTPTITEGYFEDQLTQWQSKTDSLGQLYIRLNHSGYYHLNTLYTNTDTLAIDTAFYLDIHPRPQARSINIEGCQLPSKQTVFIPNNYTNWITNDISNTISFHNTYQQAQTNSQILPDTVLTDSRIIYARVSSSNTGCYHIVPVELEAKYCPTTSSNELLTVYPVYPNPLTSTDVLQLSFYLPHAATTQLQITSLSGNKLTQRTQYYTAGFHTVRLPKQTLRKGTLLYHLRLLESGAQSGGVLVVY